MTTAPAPSEDRTAAALRGFGPLGLFAILLVFAGIVPVIQAVLALVWARLSHTPWREIGYVRPKSWLGTAAAALALGIVFKLLMKALVMPLLGAGPVNPAYHYLVHNRAALPATLLTMTIAAGFGEETFFRGYLFERLGKLFGPGPLAKALIVGITSAAFALEHYADQGLAGSEQAIITGLVFGTVFAVTGSLYPLMLAHAAFDLTAVAIIYWDLETAVAHLLLR